MNVGVSDGGERSSSGSGGGGGIPAAVAGHTDVQDLTDVTPTHFFSNLRSFPSVVLHFRRCYCVDKRMFKR